MQKTSAVSAGAETPAPVQPVQIAVVGAKLMIKCKGVKIMINMSEADPAFPPSSIIGCNCEVAIRPEK